MSSIKRDKTDQTESGDGKGSGVLGTVAAIVGGIALAAGAIALLSARDSEATLLTPHSETNNRIASSSSSKNSYTIARKCTKCGIPTNDPKKFPCGHSYHFDCALEGRGKCPKCEQ